MFPLDLNCSRVEAMNRRLSEFQIRTTCRELVARGMNPTGRQLRRELKDRFGAVGKTERVFELWREETRDRRIATAAAALPIEVAGPLRRLRISERRPVSQVIRVARHADIEGIAPLVALYWNFENIPGFNRSRIKALFADLLKHPERGHCWIAEEGDQFVGYLLAIYLFSLEHGGMMAEIDEFFVLPEKRSLKIGTALLDAATGAIAQRGIAHLQLQLGADNSRGRGFYQGHGFAVSGYGLLQKSLRP
jgi:GNAT superfamily N-acetyltransferase